MKNTWGSFGNYYRTIITIEVKGTNCLLFTPVLNPCRNLSGIPNFRFDSLQDLPGSSWKVILLGKRIVGIVANTNGQVSKVSGNSLFMGKQETKGGWRVWLSRRRSEIRFYWQTNRIFLWYPEGSNFKLQK